MIEPRPDDDFIWWLYKHRCVVCRGKATEIHEIVGRGRSKENIKDWKNRVTLCRKHHTDFHHNGATLNKIANMQFAREEYLKSIHRQEYI